MRCDEARRLLVAGEEDRDALRHLAGCAACFAAMEAADPIVPLLASARPEPRPAPAGLRDGVLARFRPARGRTRIAVIAAAVLFVPIAAFTFAILHALVSAGPALLEALGGLASSLDALRSATFGIPSLLYGLVLVTFVTCALWARLVFVPIRRVAG